MEDNQRRTELRDERAREWRRRQRDPGDFITWSVVLGGLMSVLLLFCTAYAGNARLGMAVAILLVAWVLVVWVIGGVNVVAVLWGRPVGSSFAPEREPLVIGASALLAIVSLAFPLLDLASSFDFGWYGVVSGVIGALYLIMLANSKRSRTSSR